MEIKDIKEIIKAIDMSSISEFEFQKGDMRILIKKNDEIKNIKFIKEPEVESTVVIEEKAQAKEEIKEEELYFIKSPIVGTFYSSPNPDSKPYVEVGSKVKKGDVLCIVEAMKLMNEITCDVDGEIVKIMADNGSFVEYGQPLFGIRKV
ncbi:biotin carboxyl carrier protein [Caloramator quimbayensis]|uniref:Biotin carboxyl carrier protein of acetyl-CoA carboxylase n=1 Tax=Caloramator quimbayensis TaxID=1147123 RepID=A0A1T4Y3C9_9CLOT|nr:acetyl-CoA carboxylase biotin carboxyl carrier protein [Caloramator quimbayensis]SKA96143.1 biotin carboxyl carrier protein [Caloramator quimbayensis]